MTFKFDTDDLAAKILASVPLTPPPVPEEAIATPELPPQISRLTERAQQLWAIATAKQIADETKCEIKSLDEFPPYLPEEQNPNILIKGRWLERGGSAWWISTAGTGKSIASIQFALCLTMGIPFAGFVPNTPEGKGLNFWIIQSEDSPSRVTIDREDLTAELTERYPDVDWSQARKRVKFLTIGGKVGADFLAKLTDVLEVAQSRDQLPDIVIINPFLAYIGGPISDGSFVTPFLRGGEINRQKTHGLQHLLERFNIGALIYHHTTKPPSEDDIDKWMKSPFPEYQGAGSADITNWGRSFVTMMRVKGEPGIVCMTAGKNGGELGWDVIDGASRHYLAFSSGRGISGKRRHAWRELNEEEMARITKDAIDRADGDVQAIADALNSGPMSTTDIREAFSGRFNQRRFNAAWTDFKARLGEFGMVAAVAKTGKFKHIFYGLPGEAEAAAADCVRRFEECRNGGVL